MSTSLPPVLHRLIVSADEAGRKSGWEAFLNQYSKLILHTARRASSDHDEVMDRYAYVLDRLQEEDFRRLKAFSMDGAGKFTTWLVVVVRRLCVDHHRQVYGRHEEQQEGTDPAITARKNLADMLAADVDLESVADASALHPEAAVEVAERRALLAEVLDALTTRDQLLLTLRYVDDYPAERIARMMNYPSRFAVHRRLKTVLTDLRGRLRDMGIEGP